MDTKTMIKELRRIAQIHKNDTYHTVEANNKLGGEKNEDNR